MSVNGRVTVLEAGDYRATVASVGASLLTLTLRGRHLVQPTAPDQLRTGYQGAVLVPWPNRVVGGRYAVAGTTYRLPVDEPDTGAALHGLAAFAHWDLLGTDGTCGRWELDLPPTPGYPFDLLCRARYTLDAELGLQVVASATNLGPTAAPVGLAAHPYLSCDDRPLAECSLQVPATQVLLTDDRLVPTTAAPVDGREQDLREPTLLGDRLLDHALTGLPDGTWEAVLTHPDTPATRLTSTAPWVQVFTGADLGHRGAGVEPMTCPPDAFNSDPEGVLLAAGGTREVQLRICGG